MPSVADENINDLASPPQSAFMFDHLKSTVERPQPGSSLPPAGRIVHISKEQPKVSPLLSATADSMEAELLLVKKQWLVDWVDEHKQHAATGLPAFHLKTLVPSAIPITGSLVRRSVYGRNSTLQKTLGARQLSRVDRQQPKLLDNEQRHMDTMAALTKVSVAAVNQIDDFYVRMSSECVGR